MSEMDRLEARLSALGAASDTGADWDDVLQRAGRPSLRRIPRRRLAFALAAVVVLVASAVGFLLTRGMPSGSRGAAGRYCLVPRWCPVGSTGGNRPTGATGANGATGPVGAVGPTGARRAISIDELRVDAPFVPLPNSDLANDGKVSTVWVADHVSDPAIPEGQLAAVVNYAGSRIRLSWGRGRLNAPAFELQVIAGVPAVLLPGYVGHIRVGPTGSTTTRAVQSFSWLYLAVGPDEVLTLQGRVPAAELIDVAQSLSPSPGDASPAGDLPPPDPKPGPFLTFWDGPPFYGVRASSLVDAAGSLAFRPVAPPPLGDPSAIFETDPAQTPQSSRVLSLRYDSMGRRYWVLERPSLSTTTSLLREIASKCSGASGCKGRASMIDLGGGVSALDLENHTLNRIIWVRSGVYYEVIGSDTFTPSDALSVARATAAAG